MKYKSWCAVMVLVVASGCTGCPGPEPMPDAGQDMSPDIDMAPDLEMDASDAGVDVDMCVPLTECPTDTCGMVDDGCGGMLDCGVCDCVDGQPAEEDCGPCGLGTLTCEAGVTGSGVCEAPDLAGVSVDSACSNLIYVSIEAGQEQDGSQERPFGTLTQALDAATAPALVVVSRGAFDEPDTLYMKQGVHVVGGFIPGQWMFGKDRRTEFRVSQEGPRGVVGSEIKSIFEPTVVAHLEVTADDGVMGGNTIGLWVETASELVLSNVRARSGTGGVGERGVDGANGGSGLDGESAPVATHTGTVTNSAGAGGVNVACMGANGGAGGRGSYGTSGGMLFSAAQGEDSPGGAPGGLPGTTAIRAGFDGQVSPPGANGTDGAGGRAAGAIVAGQWVLTQGDGESGMSGVAGRGGGGGGGAEWPDADPVTQRYGRAPGSSGGGGGAGGCGGEPGTGGKAGGSSLGLVVLGSTGMMIKDSQFGALSGGRGGDGGDGGLGGGGGRGGLGTQQHSSGAGTNPYSVLGGNGGDGAIGSNGGRGGGGAGGSSYGGWCEGTVLELVGDVMFSGGTPGQGGVGVNPGETGLTKEEEGCR